MMPQLLAEVDRLGGEVDVLVVTYSVDLGFVTEQLDGVLARARTVSIVADAACVRFSSRLNAGRRLPPHVQLVPIELPNGRYFHPKAVLVAGADDMTLIVGTGNCGFAGWLENGEIWVSTSLAEDGGAAFLEFVRFLDAVARHAPLDPAAIERVRRRAEAAPVGAGSASLLWRVSEEPPIADQLLARLPSRDRPRRLTIASPWFDREGATVRWLIDALDPQRARVKLQREQAELDEGGRAALRSRAEIDDYDFRRGPERVNFFHGIAYVLEWETEAVGIVGSAGCTARSLRGASPAGDAELVCCVTLPPARARELVALIGR
jgi:hypothetical protein